MHNFGLALIDARLIVDDIERAASADGLPPVCIVVTDAAGHIVQLTTMDGTPPASITVAQAKVYTVIQTGGKPTMFYADKVRNMGFNPANWADPRMTTFGGGVAVIDPVSGYLVGAVGVSGRTEKQDQDLAYRRPTALVPTADAARVFSNATRVPYEGPVKR